MIDPAQLPILMKAIDFVFDEGHKILQERRERRKTAAVSSKDVAAEPEKETPLLSPEKAIVFKQDLSASKIDERLWLNHEAEVQHLMRLLETYTRNYHIVKEQYAKWGDALVPPIIAHNLTEAENAIIETKKKLEAILSKVYNRDIQPPK